MPRVLVIYDISVNGVRERFANYLKAMGLNRIQRSAFIGKVSSQTLKDIERVARRIINPKTDIVHIFPLSAYEYTHMKVLGKPLTVMEALGERVAVIA